VNALADAACSSSVGSQSAPWSVAKTTGAAALRADGAKVVVGDLLEPADVDRVVPGCRRVYFGTSVSAGYLEATVTMAAIAANSASRRW
jgi:uncharacterized protein YbjT (DUF2867 family)